MATPGTSQPRSGNKKDNQNLQSKINLSGLKHQLHGTSYQVKLGTVVSLANAKILLDPTEIFSFTITAEDPTAGKFDDIVYAFRHGEKTGTLKIQAKHKLSISSCKTAVQDKVTTAATDIQVKHKQELSIPKITLKDCIADFKNDFCIEQYFKSLRDQPQPTNTTGLEGLIICTNAALDDDAKALWNEIETAIPNDSTTSLDSYISSLFHKTGGKRYRLKTHYKRAALARLLINAIKSKEQMVTWQRPLFKEYRAAILDIIDCGSSSENGTLFRFTANFLGSSSSNPSPGYEEFRKEFEDQYRQEFKIDGSIWDQLKQTRVCVSNDFMSDEKNKYSSSKSFPDDNVSESFISFCDQFRLVCGTYNEQGLDDAIVDIWRDLYADYEHMAIGAPKGCIEEKVATVWLFKTNFDWLKDPFAKPLNSKDIKEDLEQIVNTLAQIKLKAISDNLRRNVVGSPFRIRADALKASDVYKKIESERFLQVETHDFLFGATVVSDILKLNEKQSIFFEESDFLNNSKKANGIIPSLPPHTSCLIVICNGMGTVPVDMLKNDEMQVFLIKESCDTQTREQIESANLSEFCVRDLTEESWNQFLGEGIHLCTTTILPSKIFQNNFQERSIEDVIRLLDWGNEMEENNEISKKYREIESIYVHHPWVDSESKLEAGNIWWKKDASILKSIKEPQQQGMSFNEIIESLKKDPNFIEMFGKSNNPEEEHEPIVGGGAKKVLILLGEAGFGKSTNLTWMTWYLRKQNPSTWVVRCNLSDHCTSFKPFIQHQNNQAEKVINETEALRMLCKMVCSSLQLQHQVAEKCSKCLDLSNGEAILNKDLMEDLSFNNSIELLVFKEKFNAGKFVLLLDGFDEIAPHYKELVLNLLTHFELFKGVEKLYLTSRPYGFKQQFQTAFKDPSFFQLKPLSLKDKVSILYKLMKAKWHHEKFDDEDALADFYKSLCFMLLCSLGSMSNIALNLMMAVDIVGERVYQNGNGNINLESKTFSRKLLELIVDLSKTSFIVEEFVKVKIRHLLYDKIGADKNAADKPEEMERFEKAIDEAKLLHGLQALWVLFNYKERHIILSANEIQAGEDFMKKIHEGSEKIGIIHAISNGGITFIHRTFVEYLAAWWFVKRRIEENRQGEMKLSTLELFWKREEVRKNVDTILTKRFSLHVAIIEKEWRTVESLLSTNLKSLYETDHGNRTPFHLIALYYDFEEGWPQFLLDSVESRIINTKDNLFGWAATDYAFHKDKPQLIYYLLHHGASINVQVLFEQIASAEKDKIRKAATYSRYVMGYLSSSVMEYKSHDAYKKMKQFCDKVVANFDIVISANSEPMQDGNNKVGDENDCSRRKIVEYIIAEDSVWMLESIIHRWTGRKHFVRMIRNSFLNLESETESMFVLKYFMTKDPSIIKDDNLWDCIVLSVNKNYKDEFKYFLDLYCSRFKIKHFQPCMIQSNSIDCSIQNDVVSYLIDYVEDNVEKLVCDFRNNICWAQLGTPAEIFVTGNILSLLIICLATGRSSMLKYLIESCKLNLSTSVVYSLAMITNYMISKVIRNAAINPSNVYECLLEIASNISDVEANKMLRLAITSELFEFSKCLIERFNIYFRAVDESQGWNVFHLCASNQRSFWVEKLAAGYSRPPSVDGDRTDLFRYMLAKETDMDCFDLIDKTGRSIVHLAMENGQRGIVEHIVARKLGLEQINQIKNLRVDAIPNITFCYRAIREISKSIAEQWWYYELICMMAKQIVKISLNNREESQEHICGRLLLQEDVTELYQIAMKRRSIFLIYYLHREFHTAMPPLMYDKNWLRCTVDSLRSTYFLDVTKWLLNPNEVGKHDNLYEVVEECDAEGYDLSSVDLEKLVKQAKEILSANRSVEDSANRSVEELCKLKLLAVAVCLKRESMIRYLCETLNVNIDWKVLIDIMEIAHKSYLYKPGTKYIESCAFVWDDFIPIYKYLFERTSNLVETDVEGSNVLHLAAQNGLGCMVKFLIKHNMVNVTTTNEQNGWNIFHYYASRKRYWRCCYTENDHLLELMTKRVLEITSDGFPLSSLTECRKNKLKELCFNEGRESVIHVTIEAGNIYVAEYIIQTRLGFGPIGEHEIRNSDECSRFRECYDELSQIAAQLPFNARCEYLLHRLAKSINRFTPENIDHIKGQENGGNHVVEDACRLAIKYRSLITLEHLIIASENQMDQSLARNTSHELVGCTMECIRQNRSSMFKVLVGQYRTLQAIQPRVEVEFEVEENDNIDEATIDENKIKWRIINQFTKDVAMNRNYLSLVILSVAYGRLSMIRYLVEMLQLEVNKSLIVSIMKLLEDLWDQNCEVATPIYEYLLNRCEGKPNLLHLCAQADCWTMLKYLIEERKLDPNEIDSEDGWNIGHYCVSDPNVKSGYNEFTWLVDQYNIDCLGVYDRKGRSTLHYALENGYDRVVKYIINHRMGLIGDKQPWYEWDLEKIEKLIRELQQTINSLPEKIPHERHQIIHDVLQPVEFYMVNKTFAICGQTFNFDCKNDNERSKQKTKDIIGKDSVLMMETADQKEIIDNLFLKMIRNSFFDIALKRKSIFVLAYFMASDQSLLRDEYLWKCAAYAALKNYNIEFKYFFDLYCSQNKIKKFQRCSIQSDKPYYRTHYSKCDEIDEVCDRMNNICWIKQGTPAEIMIDEKILSLLVLCMATVRPSMLSYLIESCKLNLCAGIVYSLAKISNKLFKKIPHKKAIKQNQAYKCLLDLASNIRDDESNKILRLAITSELFEFSKCLIERFNIYLKAVDEIEGWNVFHLCASNQRSIWVEEMAADDTRAAYVDGAKTDLFRYMLAKVTDMDCFGTIDKKRRSILHLAMENGQRGIVEHIVARSLGLHHIHEIKNLGIEAISSITVCYRGIRDVSKSISEHWWHYGLICMLAEQIAKISLTNREESQELNRGCLLLQEDAKELYQMAMKRRSLFLMYYLHRKFPSAISPMIYEVDWLACTAKSLGSSDFLDFTKWLLNPNEVDKHDDLIKIVGKCDAEGYDFRSVDLEELVKQAKEILSANRSVEDSANRSVEDSAKRSEEELCKLKLLAVTVCLKDESMISGLRKIFNVNIDWKVLVDIMKIAHGSCIYKAEAKDTDGCAFDKDDFIPIYTYLFDRTSNLDEIDAKGRNVLHLATQNGLGCMVKFLIKHNKINVTTTNEQNGWNIFHYYVSRKNSWRCCYTENDWLLALITKRVLGITSDDFPISSLTESRKNKLKELCFNSDEGRESVIHVAVEAGNIGMAEYIIECRLGIASIDEHEIRNSDECSRFRECYDELSQIAAQLPFNAWLDYLLHRLAKSINRFTPATIDHIKGQENGENHVVEEACRLAIKYRSLITLEHLIVACQDQMNQALVRSTSHELVSCMMECIRRNRTSMFKVFVGHYRTLQGIKPTVEVEFEEEENDNIDEVTMDEKKINWRIINPLPEHVGMNREYLSLIILSVAYGRLSMIEYLVEMLRLEVNKSLIVLIMKVLQDLWDQNCKTATPVYEYLANRCEGKPNLLHLCAQAECWTMLKYLIEERKLDPNKVDSENGWNAGHYCVSDPNVKSGYAEFTWLVDRCNVDCFGVYDRNDRNILHYALENDFGRVVKYIISHRLGLIGDKQPWYEWDLEKIEELINKLQQTIQSFSGNIPQQKQQVIRNILDKVRYQRDSLTMCKQLFTNAT